MSVKIKSILARPQQPSAAEHLNAVSPSRCEISRLSSGSALKNLSHERYMKKLSKLKESAERCQSGSRGILESLTNLQEQYENMKNQKTNRSSLKKSIQIKGDISASQQIAEQAKQHEYNTSFKKKQFSTQLKQYESCYNRHRMLKKEEAQQKKRDLYILVVVQKQDNKVVLTKQHLK